MKAHRIYLVNAKYVGDSYDAPSLSPLCWQPTPEDANKIIEIMRARDKKRNAQFMDDIVYEVISVADTPWPEPE